MLYSYNYIVSTVIGMKLTAEIFLDYSIKLYINEFKYVMRKNDVKEEKLSKKTG